MRTTVTVDDHLLAAAKRRAHTRGQTLGQVVEDALRRELAQPTRTEPIDVPVFTGGCGPVPGVELRSNQALSEVLDRGRDVAHLR